MTLLGHLSGDLSTGWSLMALSVPGLKVIKSDGGCIAQDPEIMLCGFI